MSTEFKNKVDQLFKKKYPFYDQSYFHTKEIGTLFQTNCISVSIAAPTILIKQQILEGAKQICSENGWSIFGNNAGLFITKDSTLNSIVKQLYSPKNSSGFYIEGIFQDIPDKNTRKVLEDL